MRMAVQPSALPAEIRPYVARAQLVLHHLLLRSVAGPPGTDVVTGSDGGASWRPRPSYLPWPVVLLFRSRQSRPSAVQMAP